MSSIESLFVPDLVPALKHPTIFRKFDALSEGESFVIINDHDPKPLYYQLLAERGNIFSWEYLEQGPEIWKVHIKKNEVTDGETVGQIAAKDIRKAEVFKKLGIDFCCGGKKSLKQICEEKGLELSVVEAELETVNKTPRPSENYDRWNPDFLADYIYNKHHQYYYDEAPVIGELLAKVVGHHGENYPELQEVYRLYRILAQELNAHFAKEEKVVFPFVKALVRAKQTGNAEELRNQFSLSEPIQMMESDHEEAGEILARINEVTHGYTPPAGACNSFQFLYRKLSELEDDLHQHIHLENNILFPKALQLEKELRN
jgi:regulator of cell morphogenesis and NO signaling